MKLTPLVLSASLAFGLAAVSNVAAAQSPVAPEVHPALAPAQTSGSVARYILGPAGHVRGLQLADGAVVWVHGPEGDALAQRVPVGQTVRVEGLATQGAPTRVFLHATLRGTDGTVLVAPSPMAEGQGHGAWRAAHEGAVGPEGETRRERFAARIAALPEYSTGGAVSTVLAGPRGFVRGLLLANNTTVMLPRELSRELTQHGVHSGDAVRVSGHGGSFPLGSSVLAERVTLSDGTTLTAPAVPSAVPAVPPEAPAGR